MLAGLGGTCPRNGCIPHGWPAAGVGVKMGIAVGIGIGLRVEVWVPLQLQEGSQEGTGMVYNGCREGAGRRGRASALAPVLRQGTAHNGRASLGVWGAYHGESG